MIQQMAAASDASVFRDGTARGAVWGGQDAANPIQLNYADFKNSHKLDGQRWLQGALGNAHNGQELERCPQSILVAPSFSPGCWGLSLGHLPLLLTPRTSAPSVQQHSGERSGAPTHSCCTLSLTPSPPRPPVTLSPPPDSQHPSCTGGPAKELSWPFPYQEFQCPSSPNTFG